MAIPGLITTHVEDAYERLLEQFKGKPNLKALLDAFHAQIQELENVFNDLYVQRVISNASGKVLDDMGTIVGQSRIGFDDTRYRSLLLAKVGENTSQGDPEKVLQVVKLLAVANMAAIQEWYPAGYGLYFSNTIPTNLINFFYERLDRVDPAGVRLEALISFDEADAFAFAGPAGVASGFGDSTNLATGGKLAELNIRDLPGFAFAPVGFDNGDDGFGTLEDNLVGGIFE
jgi:hypothetical protein